MKTFVRAVVTGFGFSLGKYLFDKAKERIERDPDEPESRIIIDADLADGDEP